MHLNKNKGDSLWSNHRGIFLVRTVKKIIARIILNCFTSHVYDDAVSGSQCGFRTNWRTISVIFADCLILEKCHEQNKKLYLLFVNLARAFLTVSSEGL